MNTARAAGLGVGLGRMFCWSALLVMVMGSAWLFGQTPAAPAAPPVEAARPASAPSAPAGAASVRGAGLELDTSSGALPPFIDLFFTEPVVNSIIAFLSVVTVALFIYFLLTIRLRQMMPPDLMDDLLKLIVRRNYDAAIQICRSHRHIFVAGIVRRAIENHEKPYATLTDIIDSEGRRRADLLWNRISYLVDLSTIAPMLGLVGTVLGMLKAFFILPRESATVNSKLLAQAIGGAMTATLFGITVAVIAVVCYTIIKSRTTRTLAAIDEAVHYVADQLKRGPEAAEAAEAERRPAVAKRGVE